MSRGSAYVLVISFLLLTALGFVMLLSTAPYSQEGLADPMSGVRRQGFWLLGGLIAAGILAFTDYHKLSRWAVPLFGLAILTLILCFVPGIGVRVGGSSRWIHFPGLDSIRGQPSELAKIITVIALAAWCTKFRDQRSTFLRGFLYPLVLVALPIGLIAAEVDLGTASLIFLSCTGMLFIAGSRAVYVIGLIVIGAVLLTTAIQLIPNRMARITAFTHLNEPANSKISAEVIEKNRQQVQAMIALGAGGLHGQGLGESRQKLYFLPLPHTDSVFAIVGEEGGLIATLGVMFLFLAGGLAGMTIALHAPDRFGKLLGFGLMCLIIGQAAINIGVTTGCLPNKGMPLPFISYGGSNLFSCLIALGIVLNIYLQAREASTTSIPLLHREKLTPAV
jgi:cell division protein FtsW